LVPPLGGYWNCEATSWSSSLLTQNSWMALEILMIDLLQESDLHRAAETKGSNRFGGEPCTKVHRNSGFEWLPVPGLENGEYDARSQFETQSGGGDTVLHGGSGRSKP
jgi:hypothetical protein